MSVRTSILLLASSEIRRTIQGVPARATRRVSPNLPNGLFRDLGFVREDASWAAERVCRVPLVGTRRAHVLSKKFAGRGGVCSEER